MDENFITLIDNLTENGEKNYFPFHGDLSDADYNDSLLSSDGGAYSVSKVNITIGIVALFFWTLLMGVHVYCVLHTRVSSITLCCTLAVPIIVDAICYWILFGLVESSSLRGNINMCDF